MYIAPSFSWFILWFNTVKKKSLLEFVWNVMAHTQKPDFVFRRNGRVHLNRKGRQFIRLLADEVCGSAVVMLDTPCSEGVWRVLATHSIRQFPLHFPSRASPCAITFQLDSTFGGGYSLTLVIWWSVMDLSQIQRPSILEPYSAVSRHFLSHLSFISVKTFEKLVQHR